ncbi:MAG: hypothetical protein K2M72_08590 [Paramuribaculum sp.]|nr:hypothetical protein [Paramuribaculum sp.]
MVITLLSISQLNAKLVVTSNGLTVLNEYAAKQSAPYERSVVPTDDGVIVTYRFNYFEAAKEANSYRLSLPGFYDVSTQGSPALLTRRDAFDCPNNASPTLRILRVNHINVRLPLSSSESPVSDSGTTFFPPNTPITPYGGFLPEESVSGLSHQKSRFESMVWVSVSPFMYSVRDSIVRLCTEISYEISFNTPETSPTSMIIPPGIVLPDSGAIIPQPGISDKHAYSESADEEFLIITVNKYAESPALQEFAKWKRIQGYKTNIASRSDWPHLSKDKVLDTIKAHYSVNPNLQYILIVGDGITVPYKDKWESQGSDREYGCMGRSNILPEIRRGRWPIRSLEELETVVAKTINYEAYPPSDEIDYSNATHLSFFQNIIPEKYDTSTPDSILGKEDQPFDRNCEDVQRYLESHHNITVNRLYSAASKPKDPTSVYFRPQEWSDTFYSKIVSFDTIPSLQDYEWNKGYSEFVECLKTPQLYSLYRGHGFYDSWFNNRYNDPTYGILFDSKNVRSLSQQLNTTVLFSITCSTGDFYADCLANAWLSSQGGPVAVIAQCNTGYTSINGNLTMELFNYWWGGQPIESDLRHYNYSDMRAKKSRIGDILDCALARVLMHPNAKLATYTSRITHCFADPSLILHNSLPKEIEDVEINRGDSRVSVYTGNFMGYISLYDTQTNETHRFYGNTASIKTDYPESVSIYIEQDGYYPYLSIGENISVDENEDEGKTNRFITVSDYHSGLIFIHYITDESMGIPSISVYNAITGTLIEEYGNSPTGETKLYISRPTMPGYYKIVLSLPGLSKPADVYSIAIK